VHSPIIIKGDTLFRAIEAGDPKNVLQILQAGATVTETMQGGNTPLQLAVARRNEELVTTLLFFNADPNVGGGVHGSPVFAIFSVQVRLLNLLLEAGANTRMYGLLHATIRSRFLNNLQKIEIVQKLLDRGAELEDIRTDARQWVAFETPLMVACRENHTEIVRYLLEKDANPNFKDSRPQALEDMRSPIHAAVYNSSLEVLELLLARGVDPNQELGSNRPFALLHLACKPGGDSACSPPSDRGWGRSEPDIEHGRYSIDGGHQKTEERCGSVPARPSWRGCEPPHI
jgi:ankyrin repeat protein